MKLTETDKQFKQVAGVLGCIQGFGWFIMSLICIILYLKGDRYNFHPHNYTDTLAQLMYFVFLAQHDDLSYKGRFITPTIFHVLMWPYLILDLIWFIVSVCLITTKIDNTIKTLSRVWSIIVTIISIFDLFVTILLGIHYDKCSGFYHFPIEIVNGAFCANVILPVLMIAAKGFVLWIVNVVFARILFVRIVKKLNVGTVFHENLAVSFQAPYPVLKPHGSGYEPEPEQPIVNSLIFQNWENHLQSTPTHAHPSLQNLNQNQPEHRVTSPNVHSMSGERFQHNHILSRNASYTSQNLNRNWSDHLDHYTSPPTNSNATAPNVNSRQYALSPHSNFLTSNGPQSENRFQYPVRVPRPDFDRAPASLPSKY